jgi:hypothetical protein
VTNSGESYEVSRNGGGAVDPEDVMRVGADVGTLLALMQLQRVLPDAPVGTKKLVSDSLLAAALGLLAGEGAGDAELTIEKVAVDPDESTVYAVTVPIGSGLVVMKGQGSTEVTLTVPKARDGVSAEILQKGVDTETVEGVATQREWTYRYNVTRKIRRIEIAQ